MATDHFFSSTAQFDIDPLNPSFPEHVITRTFWILVTLILIHTFTSVIFKLAHNACTSWLQPHLTSPARKIFATATYTAILAAELVEGFWILKTDQAFWMIVTGNTPSAAPNKQNLAQWIDWLHGAVASGIPIGVTLVLGVIILFLQAMAIQELVDFNVPGELAVTGAEEEEKKKKMQ